MYRKQTKEQDLDRCSGLTCGYCCGAHRSFLCELIDIVRVFGYNHNNYKAFSWIGRRISVKDGEVYRRKLAEENEKKKYGFTEQYLDAFPFDNDITVTVLGDETGIGARGFCREG